jgi:hypothetical protein
VRSSPSRRWPWRQRGASWSFGALPVTVCLAYLGGALCPAPIRWLDPCGSGRFVVQHFNVADQVADVFSTIEIRIRDFHGGEGLLYSAYLFKRQQVGECHDTPPIGPNALLRNQAIRSPVWRCFKIVRVLQERHCSPKKTRQKTLRHDIDAWANHHGAQVSPADGGLRLMQRRDGALCGLVAQISDERLAGFIYMNVLNTHNLRVPVPQTA